MNQITNYSNVQADNPIEDSIGLRVITSAMAVVGILAACQIADTPPMLALFAICSTAIGSYISYIRRNKNNFWIKWCIAAGILVVLRFFVEDIVFRVQASITDAREPLTNMMIALLALHCFDLPRRRDLNLSALVGLVLVASACTLSRDLTFGVYLCVFGVFGLYMLYLDCLSRTTFGIKVADTGKSNVIPRGISSLGQRKGAVAGLIICVALTAGAIFLLLPRVSLGLFRNVRVSFRLNIPLQNSNQVSNPMLSHMRRQDGAIEVDPMAYFGFAKELDLNYRGELSDQVVLRVGCPSGEYWRAMAFDKFDGHKWTMSDPDTTATRVSTYGSGIMLGEVPSLTLSRHVRTQDITQVFYYEADQPNLIAAASVPYLIYFPIGNVEVDNYGAIRSPMFMEKDTVYTVFSHVPRFRLNALRSVSSSPDSLRLRTRKRLANYLQVPDSIPDSVRQLSQVIAGDKSQWFAKAEAIDNFLKRAYTYNLSIAPTPDNQDVVSDFLLKKKQGYCEHFATSFVILCRLQGIPARLVTGFTPGDHNPLTGLWEVRMKDAHAWAEVYLPRWGWVPFDPTPDGAVPGLPGKEATTAADYVIEKIKFVLDYLGQIPQVALVLSCFGRVFGPLGEWLVLSLSGLGFVWPYMVLAISSILVGFAAVKIVPLVLGMMRRPGKKAQQSSRFYHPATEQYLKVLSDLKSLDVTRSDYETAEEVSERLGQRVADGLRVPRDLEMLVGKFLYKYGQGRFGWQAENPDAMAQMCLISDKIHKSVINLKNKD